MNLQERIDDWRNTMADSKSLFIQIEENETNRGFVNKIEKWLDCSNEQGYLIDRPLGDNKYKYTYKDACVLLVPKHKITFVNFKQPCEEFEEYCEDFLEDLGSISDKFRYKEEIGRPRAWKEKLIYKISYDENISIEAMSQSASLSDHSEQRVADLLISLLTGSINDIKKVKASIPENILDKIKQKILLFDAEQTRFIYRRTNKKQIRIQGLSGTGKTELLLHKLKDLYTNSECEKIAITCHNKILADSLSNRIPEFFNFMKVEQQIEWGNRLWCVHAWGSQRSPSSGIYSYICNKYGLTFHRWSMATSFDFVCQKALEEINSKENIDFLFDYMLIDESQDFPESFFELCTKITKEKVYIAGDIFQGIFDTAIVTKISPDYLLSRCYRTDPKTLMFSHGLGMGLFEDKKLRWLEDDEWKACGYIVEKKPQLKEYILKREPLRRFEDISKENLNSVEINVLTGDFSKQCIDKVIGIIGDIIRDNQTVCAGDIGIIFLDTSKEIYTIADSLAFSIPREFGWEVNKAHETKQKNYDKVFISNRNNVKGLEFPFVICITQYISSSYSYRNGLYMSLTRSFIKSYMLVGERVDNELLEKVSCGLKNINETGCIITTEPTPEEKERINTKIQSYKNLSFYDFVQGIFDELRIDVQFRGNLFSVVKATAGDNFDEDNIKEIIEFNHRKILESLN